MGWHKMYHLLKAMGFWFWGLIAIGLSLTLVSVSYRTVSIFRLHESSVVSTARPTTEFNPAVTRSPTKDAKSQGPEISRTLIRWTKAA